MISGHSIAYLPSPFVHHWGYLLIFLISIFEAFPIIGTFLPGHLTIIASGFFAKLGILKLRYVLPLAVLGAIIGDTIAYAIGRFYGHPFIKEHGRYFYLEKKRYNKLKRLIKDHTGKAIILGRYTPITRALTPFITGISEIPFYKFLTLDVIGSLSWAVPSILLGFIFGASYEAVSVYIDQFAAVVIVLLAIGIYYSYFLRKK
jgi:membrane-associated protein